ncbi:FecR family protein [Novosphingobium terrae]|uniref:FecR family protein n=1 Tax=Novosphingobium terrae TaxID=2726189 RepID=UPI00197F4E28|nr:FecR domain-containing protein [Novosphingobium terrae]
MNKHFQARRMPRMMPGITTALNLALFCSLPSAAWAQNTPSEVTYHTHLHDTLIDLARRYFNRVEDYRVVQQLNHVPIPEHLQPDIDLRIPVNLLRGASATASVISFRGDVRLGEDRHAATQGAVLAEGTRIETGAGSFLSLRAADGSIVTLPSQSVVRLSRMRRILLTGTMDQQFSVEHGRLETTVAKQLGPASHYEVRTPIAVSAVRGTVFRVNYGEGPSLTEVLGGTVAVGAPGAAHPQAIPVGEGAAVAPGGGIHTEPLLPAPAFTEADRLQAGHELRFSLAPVPGAASYHVQIARDEAFRDIVAETTSQTAEGHFAQLPEGNWFARATAISATGFEGLPATQGFERRAHALDADIARLTPRSWRVTWRYSGDPGTHFRVQMIPIDKNGQPLAKHPGKLALDEDNLHGSALRLDDLPPGPYRWRVGAVSNPAQKDDLWTQWREIRIER